METLVIVSHHRNQYYRRGKSQLSDRFGSSPSRGFKEINCRTFQSGTGILPTPFKSFNSSSSLNKKACSSPTSHRNTEKYFENNGKSIPIPINFKPCNKEKSFNNGFSPKSCNNSSSLNKKTSTSPTSQHFGSPNRETVKPLENYRKSIPIPINSNDLNNQRYFIDDFSYSELWAGPAYSNSPPPSSLPIPTFSLRQKPSVSLEIPSLASEKITVHPIAKSAPPSPTRELYRSPDNFCLSTASATKDLRRILHLDADDE